MVLTQQRKIRIRAALVRRIDRTSATIFRIKNDLIAWKLHPISIQNPTMDLKLARDRIDRLYRATARLRDGTYGRCIRCSRTIPEKLLRRTPEQETCDASDCIATTKPTLRGNRG